METETLVHDILNVLPPKQQKLYAKQVQAVCEKHMLQMRIQSQNDAHSFARQLVKDVCAELLTLKQ